MKCNSCGAIGAANKTRCDFCGTEFSKVGVENSVAAVANQVAGTQISFAKDSFNFIGELNSTAPSGFSLWAFCFPIGYLFGYGANENGKKVAVVMLIPLVIISLLMYLSMRLAGFANAIDFLWVLFVSYLVSTRTHALVVKGGKYNLGIGLVSQILFILASYVIMSI